MTGILVEVWLNCKLPPRMQDHYSVEAGDTLEELPDRRVALGDGYVADLANILGRKYIPGPEPESLVCPVCGDVFANSQALGGHRAAKHKVKAAV